MIAVIDLGTGNLRSVCNAISAVGGEAFVSRDPAELADATAVVLPGVGAFGPAMDRLEQGGWDDALEGEIMGRGKPFLGICLGMQLIARESTEFGIRKGLGWIDSRVTRLPGTEDARVPHIGWNDVSFQRPDEGMSAGLEAQETFYFVHSYAVEPEAQPFLKGTTGHGTPFASCVERDNVWATQFHPEKSQRAGLQILRNFVRRTR